jgi:hypothetical protein
MTKKRDNVLPFQRTVLRPEYLSELAAIEHKLNNAWRYTLSLQEVHSLQRRARELRAAVRLNSKPKPKEDPPCPPTQPTLLPKP